MHNCALRLLPSHSSSFTALLQAAAVRAWVRTTAFSAPNRNTLVAAQHGSLNTNDPVPSTSLRSVLLPRLYILSSYKTSSVTKQNTAAVTKSPSMDARWDTVCSCQRRSATASQPVSFHPGHPQRPRHRPSVTYFHVENVDDSDFPCMDPGRSYTRGVGDPNQMAHSFRSQRNKDVSNIGIPVGNHRWQTHPIPLIPVPTTPALLYRNLLYILYYRPALPSLGALLDYHDLHPSLRSTRSYNLLIWLALRHCSFGTVRWLLSAMRADGLTSNLETWKLKVRWLVQTGSWDRAWNAVARSKPEFKVTDNNVSSNPTIPLPIWLELFRTLKRGVVRGRTSVTSLMESDYPTRYRVLMANPPSPAFRDPAYTSPRTVYSVVMMMLNTRHTTTALSLTKCYFHSLPPRMPAAWIRTCLDIIHLHIVMGSSEKGLKKFYQAWRTMTTLIALHPALRPTSTTLFLLLGPLQQAKRCGTVAWSILRRSRSRWGVRVEDRRVRRRVAGLAAKEGRMDIVNAILLTERVWSRKHEDWKTAEQVMGRMSMTPPPCQLLRLPAKKLFKHNGKEERRWHLLKWRIKRVIQKGTGVKGKII